MKSFLKWTGIVAGIIVCVGVLAAGTMYVVGGSKVKAQTPLPTETIAARGDSASVAWGQHLVEIHACQECHGQDLSGQVLADAPPFRAVASNLTAGSGGIGGTYTDADWERAVRHGVRPSGEGLLIMPSDLYTNLSDDELSAIIAYLRTVPPVDNALPKSEVRAMGRLILATGAPVLIRDLIDHERAHVAQAPPKAATVEYGAYRASTMCVVCHGPTLQGAPHPDPEGPWSPSLAATQQWGLDGFRQTIRTGTTPDGRELDKHYMPWIYFRNMGDDEIEALYRYISSLSFDDPQVADAG